MKIFNNIQELWEYSLYCPICESSHRTITVSLGPDQIFTQDPYLNPPSIENGINYLIIDFSITIRNQFNSFTTMDAQLKINCEDNSFEIKEEKSQTDTITPIILKKLSKLEMSGFFYMQSYCDKCSKSSSYSEDLEMDFVEKKIKNIKLERELVEFYIDSSEIYSVEQRHDSTTTWVTKYCLLDDGRLRRKSEFKSKLLDIDFSDLKKAFNRVKTILVFS